MIRKKILLIITIFIASVGIIFVSVPFGSSLKPNAGSQRIVIDIDLGDIEPDSIKIIEWKGKPVAIYKTSFESAQYLVSLNEVANGPDFNIDSIPNYFVYIPLSTHKGCPLTKNMEVTDHLDYVGFLDPCHRGFWDFSGRLLPKINGGSGLADLEKFSQYTERSGGVLRFEY